MDKVVSAEHRAMAGQVNEWMAIYAEVELLVKIGEYQKGSDPRADQAIARQDAIRDFLRQSTRHLESQDETLRKLAELVR